MDLGLFRDEEHFATFDTLEYDYGENSNSPAADTLHASNGFWEHDTEVEINGDLALIPMSSTLYDSFNNVLGCSPNLKDDINKIMSDWQSYMNAETVHLEDDFVLDDDSALVEGDVDVLGTPPTLADYLVENAIVESVVEDGGGRAFDIASYVNGAATPLVHRPGVGTKKIDMRAQKYIVHDDDDDDDDDSDSSDDVDVETVSEHGGGAPVLEAGDLNSLLEQFEATELPDINLLNASLTSLSSDFGAMIDDALEEAAGIEDIKPGAFLHSDPVLGAPFAVVKREEDEDVIKKETPTTALKIPKKEPPIKQCKQEPITQQPNTKLPSTTSIPTPIPVDATSPAKNNTAILNQLPKELIDRIKESGKRKPISVIPPMPTRKKGRIPHETAVVNHVRLPKTEPQRLDAVAVKLDHDYCSISTGYAKIPKKDSGFESSEEDDNIKRQPIVKNTDGTLMVSLLKANTIHETKKKKLNLEEYKKRRIGVLRPKTLTTSAAPNGNNCSSPAPEDDNVRRLKHQEKLMRMAKEVLKAAPRSEMAAAAPPPQPTPPVVEMVVPETEVAPAVVEKIQDEQPKLVELAAQANMVMKTVVSIGVNTDFVSIDEEFKQGKKDPLAPVHRLMEIKPLLEKVSAQIDRNSLINSMIENIPKAISTTQSAKSVGTDAPAAKGPHGEDMTILYLPKSGNKVKTVRVGVQTNISLMTQNKQIRYRRRNKADSSSDESDSDDDYDGDSPVRKKRRFSRRRSSRSSYTESSSSSSSCSSDYSSSSRDSSRSSRSRSPTPVRCKRKRQLEEQHQKEVEERRVIYVGRIAVTMSKDDLRRRFERFGPITNVSLHFRERGDNYGFVTFKDKLDAYEAIEHGNDDANEPDYDLSFGGRRIFCQTTYSDLDNMRDEAAYPSAPRADNSFDMLLKQAQEKLRKRKA